MNLKYALTLLLVLAGAKQIGGQGVARDGSSAAPRVLVHRDSVPLWIRPPQGWILRREAGRSDGAIAILHRVNESWQTGRAVLYVNLLTPSARGSDAFERAVETEARSWVRSTPGATFTVQPALRTNAGVTGMVRHFRSEQLPAYEAVAYFPQGPWIVVIALSARTQAEFGLAYAAFQALARSYEAGPSVKVVP